MSTAETDLPREPTVDEIIASQAGRPGALLPVLHAIQDVYGYIAPEHVGTVARALNVSRADVHGVITFYHYFRQRPAGRHVVQVCRAEACQAMHCERTEEHAKARLGVDYGGTSADGMFTLAAAYCLGNCAAAPSVMVGDKLYGRVTPGRLDEVLADWRDRS